MDTYIQITKAKRVKDYQRLGSFLFTILFGIWCVKVGITLGIEASKPLPVSEATITHRVVKEVSIKKPEKYIGKFTIYAYNSVSGQTDGSPCISADNKNICERFAKGEKLCASNDFKLGTIVYIKDYGDCKIVDRMKSTYSKSIDIFMGYDVATARQWGVKSIEIYTTH